MSQYPSMDILTSEC